MRQQKIELKLLIICITDSTVTLDKYGNSYMKHRSKYSCEWKIIVTHETRNRYRETQFSINLGMTLKI